MCIGSLTFTLCGIFPLQPEKYQKIKTTIFGGKSEFRMPNTYKVSSEFNVETSENHQKYYKQLQLVKLYIQ